MKTLSTLPTFVKALIITVLCIQLLCIVLSLIIDYNVYTTPLPYFLTIIFSFVISGMANTQGE